MRLAKKCPRIPTASGEAVLSRVAAGRHPADASKHAILPCSRLQAQMLLRTRFGDVWKTAAKVPRRRLATDFSLDCRPIQAPTVSSYPRIDLLPCEDEFAAEEEAAEFLDHQYDT